MLNVFDGTLISATPVLG